MVREREREGGKRGREREGEKERERKGGRKREEREGEKGRRRIREEKYNFYSESGLVHAVLCAKIYLFGAIKENISHAQCISCTI